MKSVTLDILGSCISRMILLDGDYKKKGVVNKDIKLEYFFDKNNIVSSMMPSPFAREEIESIKEEELYAPDRIKSLKQGINKDTLPMIMNGKADYLLIDFHDLTLAVSVYENTTFSNCAYEFYNTELYRKYEGKIGNVNFMDVPEFLWYPYIDLFFNEILKKFDSNHIILNRFHACKFYIDKNLHVKEIPDTFRKPFHAKYEYNEKVKKLEEYIISKVNPYIIDLTKYFITDERYWDNLNGVHYQKYFYEEASIELQDILFNDNSERVHDKISALRVSQILNDDLANDEEYIKYLNEIAKPFVSCKVLDDICNILTYKEIAKNRKVLAELYKSAYNLKEKINKEGISEKDKITLLVQSLSDEYTKKYEEIIIFIKNFYEEDKNEAVNYLEKIFLNMISEGNTEWVSFLEKLEGYAPYNEKVIAYRLEYFRAVNDIEKIEEYEKRLKKIAVTL
ncbi:hypothetical protein SAMN04487886_11752 [Clostridium sp. DSM 8431]|uniref:DUF6270 domain-containing protein n=1 Tax=Clostridium sp. DSM 8431 TaxID=1761781 RepID=UPI0008EAA851|nr:DUF6270 domain-containing protein [Clostridium sp. DSM 8431]SFU80412.1 hypothetical protein SAMN04487886_11752 [Clostridium sp. DSM 8431]